MGMSTPEWARYLRDELGVDLEPEQIASTVTRRMQRTTRSTRPRCWARMTLFGASGSAGTSRWRARHRESSSTPSWRKQAGPGCSTPRSRRGGRSRQIIPGRLPGRRTAPRHGTQVRRRGRGPTQRTAIHGRSGPQVVAVPRPENPPSDEVLNGADLVLDGLSALGDAVSESIV